MRNTINVRIGHDDDVVVAQLVRVVLVATDTAAQCCDQGAHLLRGDHLVETGLLRSGSCPERQDSLVLAVATLLGGAASRVPFHYVEFGEGRSFSWQSASSLPGRPAMSSAPFAASQFAALRAASRARAASMILLTTILASPGFPTEVRQLLAHCLFNGGLHFGRDQFVFGLGRRTWDPGTLTEMTAIRPSRTSSPLAADFGLLAVVLCPCGSSEYGSARYGNPPGGYPHPAAGCCW